MKRPYVYIVTSGSNATLHGGVASDLPRCAHEHRTGALAYNLGNFLRTLATPEPIKDWSLTSLKEKLIKIGAKGVSHRRYVAFQMAEVAIPRNLFVEVPRLRPGSARFAGEPVAVKLQERPCQEPKTVAEIA